MILNRTYLAGNAGNDAKDIPTKSGVRLVNFSLCINEKSKDGKSDVPNWYLVKAFDKLVDYALLVKKGDNVFVSGKTQINHYKDKMGLDKTSVELIASSIAILQKPASKAQSTEVPGPDDSEAYHDYVPF